MLPSGTRFLIEGYRNATDPVRLAGNPAPEAGNAALENHIKYIAPAAPAGMEMNPAALCSIANGRT